MEIGLKQNQIKSSNSLNSSLDKLYNSAEKLSSGKRINKASDDPAGLVISEKLRSHIVAIEQELKQIDSRIDRLNTADGRLEQMNESLIRIRELAITAANDSGADSQSMAAINRAVEFERRYFNRLAEQVKTDFGGSACGDSNSAESSRNIGELGPMDATVEETIESIDRKLAEVNRARGEIGAEIKNHYESRREELLIELGNIGGARSAITDVDMAAEYMRFINQKIAVESQAVFLAQTKPSADIVIRLLGI